MNNAAFVYDLFISHAEADRAWVEGYLLDALQSAGVRCSTEAAFTVGMPRLSEFERAISQSRQTLLVLSPAYLADPYTNLVEGLVTRYGVESGTWPVIPLILRPVELPMRLALLVSLDATDPKTWPDVVERLTAHLGYNAPAPSPVPPCPYPGMAPFAEQNSAHFYGREQESAEICLRLRKESFLLIVGASSSGKTSLVFGGVIPELRQNEPDRWTVRTLRPGAQPLTALNITLGDLINLEELRSVNLPTTRLLLVVDQLEEMFTQASPVDRNAFIKAIDALRRVEGCAVLLTMRADFYSDLMASALWSPTKEGLQRFEILPLRGDALREAIVRPAEDVGVYLEAGLVERLLSDVGDEPGVLPLLQEAMVLMWQQLERRVLTIFTYESVGGLSGALPRWADAVMASLPAKQQVIARRIFLRLVWFDEGRRDMPRRQPVTALRSVTDDADQFEATLQHLANKRIVVLSALGDGERMAELAHSALIHNWPTLVAWCAELREAERMRRTLEIKADEWVRLGRGSGALLDEIEMQEAEAWLSTPAAQDLGYDATSLAFVEASRAALRRRRFRPLDLLRAYARDISLDLASKREAGRLESCQSIQDIGDAYHRMGAVELTGPSGEMVRTFYTISQDVDVALRFDGSSRQYQALEPIEERLKALNGDLAQADRREVEHFRAAAARWQDIINRHTQKLVAASRLDREIQSPYVVGNPLDDKQATFVGRTDISTRIAALLADPRCPPMLLYGQRRMGKTSLLRNLGRLLPSTIVPLFVDLQGPVSNAEGHAGFLYNLTRAMTDSARRQRSLDFAPLTSEDLRPDPFTVFDEWLDKVEMVLAHGTALLVLDEFEALDRALGRGRFDEAAVLGMLRHVIQHRPRFRVLLAGSHTLDEFQRWASYLINVQVMHISYLSAADARRLIEHPVPDFPLRYEPDASQRAVAITRGHPYLVQLLCNEIVELKNEQEPAVRGLAQLADVEEAVIGALNSGTLFFSEIRQNQLDIAGQRVMYTLAAQGEGARIGEEALARVLSDAGQLARTLDVLQKLELIEPADGGYRFQVELIRRWFAQKRGV
jgi:hypothetical protein